MKPDWETSTIYFSDYLLQQHEQTWEVISEALHQVPDLPTQLIYENDNIWCRDYLPIPLSNNRFMQFRYEPDYYDKIPYPDQHPNSTFVESIRDNISNSNIILDGGNVIGNHERVILTEKVFQENPDFTKEALFEQLKKELEVNTIHIIPKQPLDLTGHSDGMLKLLDDHRLLVADFSKESVSWQKRWKKALSHIPLEIIEFPTVTTNLKNEGDYTAIGCYINFARAGNTILFPQFGLPQDCQALHQLKQLLPDCTIHPIPSTAIAIGGGALNCISWAH